MIERGGYGVSYTLEFPFICLAAHFFTRFTSEAMFYFETASRLGGVLGGLGAEYHLVAASFLSNGIFSLERSALRRHYGHVN